MFGRVVLVAVFVMVASGCGGDGGGADDDAAQAPSTPDETVPATEDATEASEVPRKPRRSGPST